MLIKKIDSEVLIFITIFIKYNIAIILFNRVNKADGVQNCFDNKFPWML